MTDIQNQWPDWGDTGELPSSGFQYAGGDRVNEKHFDALWDQQNKDKDEIIAALESRVRDLNGDVILTGLTTTLGSNALETDVSSGEGYVDGQHTGSVSATTFTHSTNGGSSTRTDVIHVDEAGQLIKDEGTTSVPSDHHKLAEVDVETDDTISTVRNYGRDIVDLVASEQPPSSPSEPDIWYDRVNSKWKYYDGAGWEAFGGGADTVTVSANYTTDGEEIVYVDSSAGAITVTLNSSDMRDGREVIVTDVAGSASTNNITVDTGGSETIDGDTSKTIQTEYGTAVYATDGSNWYSAGGGASPWVDADNDGLQELSNDTGIEVDTVLGKGIANKQTIPSGEVVNVPSDHSTVVVGPFTVSGELQVDGTLKIL